MPITADARDLRRGGVPVIAARFERHDSWRRYAARPHGLQRAHLYDALVFAGGALNGRHCVAAVLTHEVQDIYAVELPPLANGVHMAAGSETELQEAKDAVHTP